MTDSNELIQVVQIPVIAERLHRLKEYWEQQAADAQAMICTEDTIQAVKAFRADMRKQFDEVEALRKKVKQAVLEPYQQFETVYHDCVTTPFKQADFSCMSKIQDVENDIRQRCEDGLRDYFAELCAAHHLDWLEYDRAGIRVDMASAKAKTPKKLREQLTEFVVGVSSAIDRIAMLDNAEEIMVEYQRTLDATGAICTVQDRHRRIEEQRAALESSKADREREAEAVRLVEALAPPVQVEQEEVFRCTFTVRATKAQLRKLKEFLNTERISFE